MISKLGNSTHILYRMIGDLGRYRRNRSDILKEAVKQRLNESFKNYYDSVMRTYDKLEHTDELRLLKKINRM